jgi:hypothetical protein
MARRSGGTDESASNPLSPPAGTRGALGPVAATLQPTPRTAAEHGIWHPRELARGGVTGRWLTLLIRGFTVRLQADARRLTTWDARSLDGISVCVDPGALGTSWDSPRTGES